jgi:hypothetical protein
MNVSSLRRRKQRKGRWGVFTQQEENDDDNNQEEKTVSSTDTITTTTTTTTTTTPLLRRAGSSTLSSTSLSSYDDDNANSDDERTDLLNNNDWKRPVVLSSDGSSILFIPEDQRQIIDKNVILKTICHQLRGMSDDFQKSGLPWDGIQCRSTWAGLSGIVYCLPIFVCHNHRMEQTAWVLQAFLSIMADYVHIHHESYWHGIDRFYATYNVLSTIIRASFGLHYTIICTSIIPISCFVLANQAKNQQDLHSWQYYHGWWHLSGSVIVAYVVYLLYTCPSMMTVADDVSSPHVMFCKI